MRIAFIGSAGIPNRYGGFESFLEHSAPSLLENARSVVVTCDASLYKDDQNAYFNGVRRIFLGIRANGAASIFHDLIAFMLVFWSSTHIMVLGVSGGLWFPLFKLMCRLSGKRLGVNIDGVEWRRAKYGRYKQRILRFFDYLAQRFADVVVYDNAGLYPFVHLFAKARSVEIGYSGDHVLRLDMHSLPSTALTICRIEPENNLEMLIEAALNSNLDRYTIVGNWDNSDYGRSLRKRYQSQPRLTLLGPIYDAQEIAALRERCSIYLHGHSVGGTNPSLVEMIFYDCALCCFDVVYNRVTAGACAAYFTGSLDLAGKINAIIDEKASGKSDVRDRLRTRYTSRAIASAYFDALTGRSRPGIHP